MESMLVKFTPARASYWEDANRRPSALQAMLSTQRLRGRESVKSSRPLATSLILIDGPPMAEASRLPSWLNVTVEPFLPLSKLVLPGNERGSLAAFRPQSLTLTPG